jgi:hypothetical protein
MPWYRTRLLVLSQFHCNPWPNPNGVELVLAEVRKYSGELPNAAISQPIITGRLAPFR